MKLKFGLAISLVIWLFLRTGYGQSLEGKVKNSKMEPSIGASIYLNAVINDELIKVELTDSIGHFLFNNIEPGNYQITVSYLGKETVYGETKIKGMDTLDIGTIILDNDQFMIDEVVVQGNRQLIEQKIDRTVVNVERLVNTGSGTAIDIIEKSPGLRIGENGQISLRGRTGVTVFINDKPTNLSGADLENYLRSLPSSAIKQLEIMTNPPAQYDAAGNAGVINIKTKKNSNEGFNVGLNVNLTQHRYTSSVNNLNYTYQKGKVNLYGNIGFSNRNGFSDLTINRNYYNEDLTTAYLFRQNSEIRRMGYEVQKSIGLDFYISEKTTLGLGLNGVYRKPKSKFVNVSEFLNIEEITDSSTHANNLESGRFINGSANIYVKHEFKEGQDLSFDADYLKFRTDNNQTFNNTNYGRTNNLISSEDLLGYLESDIAIYSFKSDYSHTFSNGLNLSGGGKVSFTSTDNIADYYLLKSGQKIIDFEKTNRFKYNEDIQALYVNLNKEFKKVQIQLGLRYERTELEGKQFGNPQKADSSFTRSYDSFFPTFYLMYNLDTLANHQLKLNYGRRIDRPYYQDLNPFLTPIDKFTYLVGNPFLLPSFSHKAEIAYTFKKRATASFAYSKATNQTSETIEINDGIYYSRPGNIGSTEIISFSLDGNYDLRPWLSFQFFGSVDYLQAKGSFYGGYLDVSGVNGYFQGMTMFKLPKEWAFQLDGNYQTDVVSAQFKYKSKWALNLGVMKKFGNSSSLRFAINDIFYTNINQGTIRNLHLADATYKNVGDTRKFTLSYSLMFGGLGKTLRNHISDGAHEEKNRVKQ